MKQLGIIDAKRAQNSQMRYFLDLKHQDHANAGGKMTDEQKKEYLKKFEADLIFPADAALWKRGDSNTGYHFLGGGINGVTTVNFTSEANTPSPGFTRVTATASRKWN